MELHIYTHNLERELKKKMKSPQTGTGYYFSHENNSKKKTHIKVNVNEFCRIFFLNFSVFSKAF